MGLQAPLMGAIGGLAGNAGIGGLAGMLANRGRRRVGSSAVNKQMPVPQGGPQDAGNMSIPFPMGQMEPFAGTPPVLQDMPLQDLAGLQQFVPHQAPVLRQPGAIYEDYGGAPQGQFGGGIGGLLARLGRRY